MSVEAVVAKVSDLADGDMKEVMVGETKVLLTRIKGKFHAIGGECSHYGGPLAEGSLSGERVVCPWHQANFNVVSGDLLEPPALDALARLEVRVAGDQVIVRLPEEGAGPHPPSMCRCQRAADGRTFVILGAGAAGNMAAQTLREDGFQGRILMITRESRLPYDRPNLSKGYLSGAADADSLPLRGEDFYRDHDIEVLLGREVAQVEAAAKTISFTDGASLAYDALLLATGGAARSLEVQGAQLANVFTLRSAADAEAIIAAAGQATRAVVVGASFIGMETAASLTKRGLQVTVVGPGAIPFTNTLGPEIGAMLIELHQEHGVSFRMGERVARLEGAQRVETVVLDSGKRLAADLVLTGVGIRPATEFLQGVPLNPDGSVSVDRHLRVSEGLYAAGDLARFPDWRTGEDIRIEHWRLAEQHGRVAAHNMAGQPVEFRGVPFFWTEQFDLNLQYVGYTAAWDEIIFHGELKARKFLAFYIKGDRVLAAAGLDYDRQMTAIAELMRLERMPAPAELRLGPVDLAARLREAGK
jgi:apoptosis-inducing factor 3